MSFIEVQAKTVEDAIKSGLEKLGVSIADIDYDVIDPGKKGLLGLIGNKDAIVRITLKEDPEEITVSSEMNADAEKHSKASVEPSEQKSENLVRVRFEKPVQPKASTQESAEKTAETAFAAAEPTKASDYPAESAEYKALDFLSNLTRLMGVEVKIYLSNDEADTIRLNMFGDSKGVLIGRRGETLDSLQYLTSLYVNRGRDNYTRVTLDTENYRAKREEALRRLANRMANRVVKTGRKVIMEPMNPYERRILHSALQSNDAVTTHSEGEEPNRHVVITLKNAAKASEKNN